MDEHKETLAQQIARIRGKRQGQWEVSVENPKLEMRWKAGGIMVRLRNPSGTTVPLPSVEKE